MISIIIYNYNCDRLLESAINSVLQQSYDNFEVIVVDDGSVDNSQQIIDRYTNKIIALSQKHLGEAVAFNTGFTKSQGDIICFLESGDLFLADKLKTITTIFKDYPQAAWCFHDLKSSEEIDRQLSNASGIYDVRDTLKYGKLGNALPLSGIETSALCFQRSLLEKSMPIPEDITAISNDYLKYTSFATSPGFILLETLTVRKIEEKQNRERSISKQKLQPTIHIITSYWLKKKFPELAKFADNIFALGLRDYRKSGEKNLEVEIIIKEYFKNIKLPAKLKIKAKNIYRSIIDNY
jgi:glycosyltransferase involved in cell wall biosynthesis